MTTSTTIADSTITANNRTIKTIKAQGTPVYRVVARNNVVYDRKDYVLSAASTTIQVPITGGTLTLSGVYSKYSGYNASNQRVNNADIGYTYSPASFPSNAYNETPRQGVITIVQETSELQLSGLTYNQPADGHDEGTPVCTSMTITIIDVPDIPASGGSVNSCQISVQANGYLDYEWASGGHSVGPSTSWTLSSSDYTTSWTGVSAQSLGTTITGRTSAGTLYCQVTYTGDTSITATKSATVYQEANSIMGYTDYVYTMLVETNITGNYPAVGGNVDVEYTAQKSRQPIYTSKATGSTITTDAVAYLSTNIGTISPTTVSGSSGATLSVPANNSQLRTITVTITSQDDSTKTGTTSFVQSYSTFSVAYAYLSNQDYISTTPLGTNAYESAQRQEIQGDNAWNSATQTVYAVTEDGVTQYRTGTTSSADLVARGTYFYNNSNLLFNTRDVLTAGTVGTEYLWYKNDNWNFSANETIPYSATSFTVTGSTNTSYKVVVTSGYNRTIMTVDEFTGSLTVPIAENTATTSDRTYTLTFTENNPSAVNKPTMQTRTITQERRPRNGISASTTSLTICVRTIPTPPIAITVTSIGSGWTAQYDSTLFYVSPTTGDTGTTNVSIRALAEGPSTGTSIEFKHNQTSPILRARVRVTYDNDC